MRPNLVKSDVAQLYGKWTAFRNFSSSPSPTKNNVSEMTKSAPRKRMSFPKALLVGYFVFAFSEMTRYYFYRYPEVKKRREEYNCRLERHEERFQQFRNRFYGD